MYEKIEDELSRTRKFREERQKRITKLKELGVPDVIIEYEEYLATLTHKGYLNHIAQIEKEEKQKKIEYAKNNKLNETVVKNIFKWFDKNGDSIPLDVFDSQVLTDRIIDPLGPDIGMSEEDYKYDLYTPLIRGLIDQLIKNRTKIN